MKRIRTAPWLAACAGILAPSLAWACPVCAGRETDTSLVLTLVGMMIAVPYGISVVAIRVIRKADQDNAWPDPPDTEKSQAQKP